MKRKPPDEAPAENTPSGAPLPDADWITMDELANHLRVPHSTAHEFFYKQNLPYIRIGRLIRIRREPLVRHLDDLATNHPCQEQDKASKTSNEGAVPSGPD